MIDSHETYHFEDMPTGGGQAVRGRRTEGFEFFLVIY